MADDDMDGVEDETPDPENENSEDDLPEEIVEVAQRIIPTNIEDEMRQSYLNYAMSVILSRALPDVRDGLKPVQRRILMAMHDLNLTPGAQYRKSAKIVGEAMGNYHPHGDAALYLTMVRLGQDFSMRYPLVDGQGNFGSVDGDPPAAPRYTEARMSQFSVQLLNDLEKESVEWMPNYDGSRVEPLVLPAAFPNLLCNGSEGIAVGMATKIPPHNLREVIDACIYQIDNPDCTLDDLMKYIKGPDFPTAGLILGTKGIRQAYETGHGSVIMQGQTNIEDAEGGKSLLVITR
jgi:DNA gyrase subunit A